MKFDWDIGISNIQLVGQYSFVTGELTNIQLLNNYNVDIDWDAHGIGGFFIDLIDALGFIDTGGLVSDLESEIENTIGTMFEAKFSGVSKIFIALDQIIPASIMYQGQNISPQIVDALIAPISGRNVTITTDLDTSTNQSLTVNLWNKFIVTARRIKPVINRIIYEYNNCVGTNRSGNLSWSSAGSGSNYTLQKKSGSIWYVQYSGSSLQSFIVDFLVRELSV